MVNQEEKKSLWSSFRARIFYILLIFVVCFSLTLNMLLHHQYADHIDTLSNDLIAQANENVIEKSSDYLMPAVLLSESTARMVTNGTLNTNNKDQLESLFLTILKPYPQLKAIYFGDEYGNFFMVNRVGDKTVTKEIKANGKEIVTFYKTRNKDNSIIKETTTKSESFNPKLRPWYKGAKSKGERFWTDIYMFFSDKQLGITASYPMYNSNKHFKGVFGVDISLSNISEFLNAQRISKKGHMFILNDKNRIVALPTTLETKHSDTPLHINDLGKEEIIEAVSIRDSYNASKFTYTVNGKDYFASFVNFPEYFGKRWTTALIVPSHALTVNKVMINRLFFIFLGISILIIYLISILLTRSMFDPLNIIVKDMKNIKNANFDEKIAIEQSVKEIDIVVDTYMDMKNSLKNKKSN
jgi:adenylate cyclase